MSTTLPLPPRPRTAEGRLRRAGFELELAGVEMATIEAVVVECFGGRVVHDDRFSHRVRETVFGDFVVEIDTAVLKHGRYHELLAGMGIEVDDAEWLDRLDDGLARLAATVVPHEVVTPPVPVDRIEELEALRAGLRARQAQGTRAALRFAFGLHINPEAPTLDAADVAAHIKAFLLLRDALKVAGDVDISRRVAPFIRDFPEDYARRVVDPDYRPDWPGLIGDYVADNATRNRPLDMLPLFAHVRPGELPEALRADELIKPRPTYHYRLPNCAIDEADWRLCAEWRRWLAVERLAATPDALAEVGSEYRARRGDPIGGIDRDWARHTAAWVAF